MSVSVCTSRGRRALATAAAAAFAGASLTALTTAPAHAAPPLWLATEMSLPIDPVGTDKCTGTTRDGSAIADDLPTGYKVERVVEGPMQGKKACADGKFAYLVNGQWFGASADTVDRGPRRYDGTNKQQIRIVARWDGQRHAIMDKVVDRKRSSGAMKKDEVGYHLTGVWRAGTIPGFITVADTVFDGKDLPLSTPADEGIARGDEVTMQFVPNDGTAS